MLSPSIAFRRNLLSLRIQYLKPLSVCWRSQKTEARHLESQESLDGWRSFGEIPQRNRWTFMYDVISKTEGFTKPFKFVERLFDELGPIYKEDFTMRPATTMHVIDPEDLHIQHIYLYIITKKNCLLFEQISNSVLWWLYNLARFPEVQEKLYQEIESVLGEDDDVTPKHLAKLSYLKACLKESMR